MLYRILIVSERVYIDYVGIALIRISFIRTHLDGVEDLPEATLVLVDRLDRLHQTTGAGELGQVDGRLERLEHRLVVVHVLHDDQHRLGDLQARRREKRKIGNR